MRALGLALAVALLAGCAARTPRVDGAASGKGPIEVHVLAFNDFHGNLEPPGIDIDAVPAGGAAWLAATIGGLRKEARHSITVSAGDMTGASPLMSSIFLDEPTVAAMNLIGVDLNAAGNHEFDRGAEELLRLQRGGCAAVAVGTSTAKPCTLEPFAGAGFTYLAGNTITAAGQSLLPATALRRFTEGGRTVTIGFIGLTTRTTQTLVSPAGIPGIRFADEADIANAEAAKLKAAGADAIVVLIHEGGAQEAGPNDCRGLSGAIRPILDRLDPRVDLIVSGHTHRSYICDYAAYAPGKPFLLTSAGKYGTLVTDAVLAIDPATHRVVAKSARNVTVRNQGVVGEPRVAKLVARYAAASAPLAARPSGRLTESLPRPKEGAGMTETRFGNLIADAELAAGKGQGAQVAFMNPFGIRGALTPKADGSVTYGDLYAVQPFGNTLTVRAYTGAELRAVLEQQLDRKILLSVAGMTYAYDAAKPAGSRITDAKVGTAPLDDRATYRVVLSDFLAFGGDGFSSLTVGRYVSGGPVDVEAMATYLSAGPPVTPPPVGRIRVMTRP
ncbi:bifunctional metallophosphatase/5'-nucleotidase [Sphingomonas sp. KR1UV-12]|uniref:Bifunctional metallophosphatase/5'-nucleotidase n=1 Tax=Sphingomonas aurea TaxID=3063994 RepID=A0ABT9ELZ1_9SPHN|nr:bifunctional metallophosphatase/5'-nucleotidase [Sphingomonas sp. KR1UV-12]MDP1027969.1 bifunctional metallophosphatase/5'-nucleotidase [Sphingomonas sp. KR1UV-12]